MRNVQLFVAWEQNGEMVATTESREAAMEQLLEVTGNSARGSAIINLAIPHADEGRLNLLNVEQMLLHAEGTADVLEEEIHDAPVTKPLNPVVTGTHSQVSPVQPSNPDKTTALTSPK